MQSHPESNGSQFLHGGNQTVADEIGLRSLSQTGTAEAVPMHRYNPVPQETSAGFSWDNRVSGNDRSMAGIETAARDAVLREQEIATQRIIHSQRQAKGETEPSMDNTDILLGRWHDPNAIKEHLLKMTTDHRAEMASKRGKSTLHEEGNTEIGNGYGVPGGGAYYGASRSNIATPLKLGIGGNEGHKSPDMKRESEEKSETKGLPEYLKQKLRARGILKDDTTKGNPATSDNKLEAQSTQNTAPVKLSTGWVEAKDPASGVLYYYNENTGMSQWERPVETSFRSQPPAPSSLPEDWEEALDVTTGNSNWVQAMKWSDQKDFQVAPTMPYLLDDKEAGQLQSHGPLAFLKVHNAGHMVPMDQPKDALQMLKTLSRGSLAPKQKDASTW